MLPPAVSESWQKRCLHVLAQPARRLKPGTLVQLSVQPPASLLCLPLIVQYDDPVLLAADVEKKEGTVRRVCEPILSKKPPPPPKKEEPAPQVCCSRCWLLWAGLLWRSELSAATPDGHQCLALCLDYVPLPPSPLPAHRPTPPTSSHQLRRLPRRRAVRRWRRRRGRRRRLRPRARARTRCPWRREGRAGVVAATPALPHRPSCS